MTGRIIPNTNEIELYLHCQQCIDEKPKGISPMDWQKIQVGWTQLGLQVWCVRHDCNIMHIDFEGVKHRANTTRREHAEN
jgi:hypothetical protein